MRRFIATYRWELWLLLGIPVANRIVLVTAAGAFGYVLDDYTGFAETVSRSGPAAAAGVVSVVLLGVSYLRVRRLGRPFLSLFWGYSLASAAIGVLLEFIGAGVFSARNVLGSLTAAPWPIGLWGLTMLVLSLPVTLWFARQASRFSLAHAFFLVLVGVLAFEGGNVEQELFGVWWAYELSGSAFVVSMVSGLESCSIGLVGGVLGAWLLGNFERRGPVFRRRAVYGVLAFYGYGWLHSGFVVLAIFGWSALDHLEWRILPYGLFISLGAHAMATALNLALVYLVRVRDPAPAGAPPLSPSEER